MELTNQVRRTELSRRLVSQLSWELRSSALENWPRGSENFPDYLPCRMTKGLIVYTGTP